MTATDIHLWSMALLVRQYLEDRVPTLAEMRRVLSGHAVTEEAKEAKEATWNVHLANQKRKATIMTDTTEPIREYFTDEEVLPVLELSRQQFTDSWKREYKISDDRVLAALKNINESDDYAKIIWRVQQENPHDERYFDTNYLARGITNIKLFYSLEIVDGRNLHSLSKTLDVFWHAHQNFSFEYMRFCDKVFGSNQFLHHTPSDKRDKVSQESLQRRYDYSRAILGKMARVDEAFWGGDVVPCCSYEALSADGFVFWRPALIAVEPPCDFYDDPRLNEELKKKVNLVLDGFS